MEYPLVIFKYLTDFSQSVVAVFKKTIDFFFPLNAGSTFLD